MALCLSLSISATFTFITASTSFASFAEAFLVGLEGLVTVWHELQVVSKCFPIPFLANAAARFFFGLSSFYIGPFPFSKA